MRLVQELGDGSLRFETTVEGAPSPTQALVKLHSSLISSGTERNARSLASASLISKARSRPDLVREVIHRAGRRVFRRLQAVQGRLSETMPLAPPPVLSSTLEGCLRVRPGDRVATAGAPHGDFRLVAGNLIALSRGGQL